MSRWPKIWASRSTAWTRRPNGVYSELGGGTSFKIYLPRVDAEAATALRAELAVTTTMGTETILVVEDNPLVLRATARILRKHGYTVLEAASGGDALLILERQAEPIALVFTDIVMPLMSGRELADRVKAARPALPVLFTSGYTDNAIVHHGVLDADTIFVEKPFTEENLLRKVRECSSQRDQVFSDPSHCLVVGGSVFERRDCLEILTQHRLSFVQAGKYHRLRRCKNAVDLAKPSGVLLDHTREVEEVTRTKLSRAVADLLANDLGIGLHAD